MKTLIILLSKELIPNYRIFKEIKPDRTLIISTPEMSTQKEIIKSLFEKNHSSYRAITLNDAFDFNDISSVFDNYLSTELKNDDIYLNITGGTKIMALAAYSSFEKHKTENSQIFYLDLEQNIHYLIDNKKVKIKAELILEEFVTLSGQQLKKFNMFNEQILLYDKHLQLFRNFAKNPFDKNYKAFIVLIEKVRKLHDKEKKDYISALQQITLEYKSKNKVYFSYDNELFNLKIGTIILKFNLNLEQLNYFIFNAGWFELISAQKIIRTRFKNINNANIFTNVEFPSLSTFNNAKNEVDILINDGGKLVFIECKSGDVNTSDIDKIVVRKQTYGGLISKSILITLFPLNTNGNTQYNNKMKLIKEKCKDNDIELLQYNKIN